MKFTLKAPAKINLYLKVVGGLPDGRHELLTVMQPVSVFDTLTITDETAGLSIACDDESLAGDDNLVLKAARAWFAAGGLPPRAGFKLEKRIPKSAGLGGGSSDAAAALLGLNALNKGLLPPERLLALARELGSDVPFFLGGVTALCRGAGDLVEPRPDFPLLDYVLVNPGFEISTAWVYQQFDLQWTNGQRIIKIEFPHRNSWSWNEVLVNDLEAVTLKAHPLLQEIKQELLSRGALVAMMSGSGPTVFGIFPGRRQAEEAAESLAEENKWWVRACWGIED